MFYAGEVPTAGKMNDELGVATFFAGAKVRASQLETFVATESVRAQELNRIYSDGGSTPPPDPDPGGGTPADPGEALWIGPTAGKNHFNVGIGNSGGSGSGTTHTDQDDIANGFTNNPKFILTGIGDVQFRIGVNDGRTSENTQYPRSELRELTLSGANAAWNGSSGTHYMKGRSRITHVAATKPWVCFFQIHDSSSDLVRVQTETGGSGPTGLRIRARRSPPSGGSEVITTILNSYTVGQWLDWDIRIVNGTLSISLDGTQVLNASGMGTSGCYFKTGCYAQSNATTEGGDTSQFFSVEIAKGSLECWHTGYAAPTTPVFTG
jgi:hypothetical protein